MVLKSRGPTAVLYLTFGKTESLCSPRIYEVGGGPIRSIKVRGFTLESIRFRGRPGAHSTHDPRRSGAIHEGVLVRNRVLGSSGPTVAIEETEIRWIDPPPSLSLHFKVLSDSPPNAGRKELASLSLALNPHRSNRRRGTVSQEFELSEQAYRPTLSAASGRQTARGQPQHIFPPTGGIQGP